MTVSWTAYLYTMLASIGGGFVQSTTGFGFGVIAMIFFPLYLTVVESSAVSQAISFFLTISLVVRYRKYIQFKAAALPVIVYVMFSSVMINSIRNFDFKVLEIVFACFMILLAIYMLIFSKKVKVKGGPLSAIVCSALSGTASGLFGVGGPPMTVYYMALFGDNKFVYLGTLQCFFLMANIANNTLRLANGILTPALLLMVIPGVVGQAIGVWFGNRLLPKIPVDKFRYVVYGVLVISGVVTLITKL